MIYFYDFNGQRIQSVTDTCFLGLTISPHGGTDVVKYPLTVPVST